MVDAFVLLQLPNAGDDLQAIKKGIVEIADLVVINKADIDPKATAVARAQWRNALHLVRRLSANWEPPVLTVSAPDNTNDTTLTATGEFAQKRRHQSLAWMWQLIEAGLHEQFREHPGVQASLSCLSQSVEEGLTTPAAAAHALLAHLKH
jgi:LAO/AO transport system kinase